MRQNKNLNKKITKSMRFTAIHKIHTMRNTVLALMVILFSSVSMSTIDAQCDRRALACNNLVNVSLDINCEAVITLDMILEDQQGADSDYELRIYDPEGNRIESDTLRDDYDCEKLEVQVECLASGIYCWGYIVVEDKIKPSLTITPLDTAVYCYVYDFDLAPNSLVTEVSFSDNTCEKPDSLGIIDIRITPNETCSDTLEIIKRFWSVVDKSKYQNDSTVVQTIYLLRPTFDQFEYPTDTIIDCREVGDLSVDKLGKPELRSCDDYFDVLLTEIEFPGICGAGRKISRSWKIVDACRNRDTTVYQSIEIIDTSAATIDYSLFELPASAFTTSKEDCTASAENIPNPIIDDCSIIQPEQVRAFYQFVDDSNIPFGFRYDGFVNDMQTFDLIDIPVGQEFIVIFEVTDSCGNISSASDGPFIADDTSDPNAVCEKTTIVAINASGLTEVTAESLDDYSYDNCGVVRKEIRRMDSNCDGYSSDRILGSSVHFCCEDVADNPIRVLLRVYDAYDNHSDCIIDVIVQDKRVPTITCPSDLTLGCDFDLTALESRLLQNPATADWVCGPGTILPSIPDFELSSCGFASILVTWTATDANGASSTCTQRVTFDNLGTLSYTDAPAELIVTNCNGGTDPESIGGAPTVNGVTCEQIAITYEDVEFEVINPIDDDPTCRKITRKWTILDWCQFQTGNLNSAILRTYTQIIKIQDNNDPVFSTPLSDFEVTDTDRSCDETVTVSVNASDDCTDTEDLTLTYEVMDSDGDIVLSGADGEFSQVFSTGSYIVTFTVEDACGNMATTSATFTVVSNKEPQPVLVGAYPVNIQANGMVTLLASDMNIKSVNGCVDSEDNLVFAFSSNPTNLTKTFTCADIPNGVSGIVPTSVFVIDAQGNYNSATVDIMVSDENFNACTDNTGAVSMQGVVTDEELKGVANIAVNAFNPVTEAYETVVTDENGRYKLAGLASYQDYMVTPELSGYDLEGVSTLDLVLIQRHILGLAPLSSPYKIIAADINGTKSITGADLAELRKLILGTKTGFGNAASWRFIRSDYEFDNNLSPWDYPAMAEVFNIQEDLNALDFIGLKVGDVNGGAFAAIAQELAGPRSSANLTYTSEQNEDLLHYTLTPSFADDLLGLQFAIDFDADQLTFESIENGSITLTDDMIAVEDGSVKISWIAAEALNLGEGEMITLTFTNRGTSIPALSLDQSMSPEVYNAQLETSRLTLSKSVELVERPVQLLQNVPNPFVAHTTIDFVLAESGSATLNITDMNGRMVHQTVGSYNKGMNKISLQSSDLSGSGIYYYTLITAQGSDTKRMIVLN